MLADSRPRIRGRFARHDETEEDGTGNPHANKDDLMVCTTTFKLTLFLFNLIVYIFWIAKSFYKIILFVHFGLRNHFILPRSKKKT